MVTLDTRAIISSFAPFNKMMLEAERIIEEFEEHFQWTNIPTWIAILRTLWRIHELIMTKREPGETSNGFINDRSDPLGLNWLKWLDANALVARVRAILAEWQPDLSIIRTDITAPTCVLRLIESDRK